VLIRSEPRPKESSGGIVLPAEFTAAEKIQERAGEVIRIGGPRDRSALPETHRCSDHTLRGLLEEVKVGDRVLFRGFIADANNLKKQWGIEDAQGREYSIIDIRDILAVIGSDVRIGPLQAARE